MVRRLVLLRHGESEWNLKNLFTGWYDCDLTATGEAQAVAAGRLMAERGVLPDVVHTSVLVRGIRTAELALREMGRSWIPVRRSWRLNERHYGDLQGLNKKETAEFWFAKSAKDGNIAPQRKLANEKPKGETVDYDTLVRTPKRSYEWYAAMVAAHRRD